MADALEITQQSTNTWKKLLCYGLQTLKDKQPALWELNEAEKIVDDFCRWSENLGKNDPEPEQESVASSVAVPSNTCDLSTDLSYDKDKVGEVFGE